MSAANERQVGGDHYKVGGEEHWDRAWRLGFDPFQYQITKYIERWRSKNGIQDLEKAAHFLQKYIELAKAAGVKGAREPGVLLPIDDTAQMALDTLLKTEILTETGTIRIGDVEWPCLKGSRGDFQYEGGFGDGRNMWTCTGCREKLYTHGRTLPHALGHVCKSTDAPVNHDADALLCAQCKQPRNLASSCFAPACPHRLNLDGGGDASTNETVAHHPV